MDFPLNCGKPLMGSEPKSSVVYRGCVVTKLNVAEVSEVVCF